MINIINRYINVNQIEIYLINIYNDFYDRRNSCEKFPLFKRF